MKPESSYITPGKDGATVPLLPSDDEWWETEAEFFTSYEFQTTVPDGATIQSVKIYIEHWEEEDLSAGSIQWEVGTGLLTSPAPLATQVAPLHFSEEAEATDVWDVSTVLTRGNVAAFRLRTVTIPSPVIMAFRCSSWPE